MKGTQEFSEVCCRVLEEKKEEALRSTKKSLMMHCNYPCVLIYLLIVPWTCPIWVKSTVHKLFMVARWVCWTHVFRFVKWLLCAQELKSQVKLRCTNRSAVKYQPNDTYLISFSFRLDKCNMPLGMADRRIANPLITASSYHSFYCGPWNARLHQRRVSRLGGSWCARRNDLKQYLQVQWIVDMDYKRIKSTTSKNV